MLHLVFLSAQLAAQYSTNIIVAKDGTGDYTSIQEAINSTKAFPDQPITVFIKKGIYNEKITIYEWNNNLNLTGESRDSTIIEWSDYFKSIDLGRNSTFHTYTLKIESNDLKIENLTIINNAGPVGQAVALHLAGDRVAINNCTIKGHQDTIYATGEGFRQYFRDCLIEGTTDFIFGSATVIFDECVIHSKSNSYITASSTPASAKYGFIFKSCMLTADAGIDQVYLGRPWRPYARTVYLNCELGDHILPAGWDNWSSKDTEKTAFYAEYNSSGPGANSKDRVEWSKQLSKKEASKYTVDRIFRGWKP